MRAVRSCSWNRAMMTKRKITMGRSMRIVDDWGKDGCIAGENTSVVRW